MEPFVEFQFSTTNGISGAASPYSGTLLLSSRCSSFLILKLQVDHIIALIIIHTKISVHRKRLLEFLYYLVNSLVGKCFLYNIPQPDTPIVCRHPRDTLFFHGFTESINLRNKAIPQKIAFFFY